MVSSSLRIGFIGLTDAQASDVIDHYNGQVGTYVIFDLPADVWSGTSDFNDYTLSGYFWRYAAPPSIEDLPCGRHNIDIQLESVTPQSNVAAGRQYSARITWTAGSALGLALDAAEALGVNWPVISDWAEVEPNGDADGDAYDALIDWTPGTAQELTSNFDIALYTGTGATLNVTGVDFEPGLVWIKRRNVSTGDHVLFDYARGATKYWRTSNLGAEVTSATTLTSFDSNGFTLGSSTVVNTSGSDYVAWCWKEGAASASNTDGNITTTAWVDSVNKFAILQYTGDGASGATIGHGLGVTPDFIMVKNLTTGSTAPVAGGNALGANKTLSMFANSAVTVGGATDAPIVSFTSSTITLAANNGNTNSNGAGFIAYAFASLAGVRKFGTYSGGGATATTVTTDFQPRLVILKSQSATTNWMYFDNDRGVTKQIIHTTAAETTVDKITFSSTGFTVKANEDTNTSSQTFLYAAFA
jgi:hypothetical protein